MKIAISGLSGVGTSSTAKMVAAELKLPMNNFTFRDLAKEKGVAWEELQRQAETDDSIDFELDRRLIEFIQSHDDCLISTDLACWLDEPSLYQRLGLDGGASYDLKIWLEASHGERARRMSQREGKPVEQIMAEDDRRDHKNRERYKRLYGVDLFDYSKIDWVIDTEKTGLEEVVAMIVDRARQMVYTKPEDRG